MGDGCEFLNKGVSVEFIYTCEWGLLFLEGEGGHSSITD